MNMVDVNIQMRLVSVDEVLFSMFPEKLIDVDDSTKLKIGFMANVIPEKEKDNVSMVFGVKYVLAEDTLLESQYKFRFEVKDLQNYLKYEKDNNIVIQDIMPHFLSVAVGTMRGILVVKTAGTSISAFPLPMINIEDLCSSLMTEVGK